MDCNDKIIKFSLPNEITPLPTKMYFLPTFSIFAQTLPFFAQTPPFFAQPSTFTRPPGSRAVKTHWFRWKAIDVCLQFCCVLRGKRVTRRTQLMADNATKNTTDGR